MALQPYREEDLNYFKFSSLVLNEFPRTLRKTFKMIWDNSYGHRPGFQLWDDSNAVRNLFGSIEGDRNKVPVHQSYNEWDCTALFQATLYSRAFALHHGTLNDLYIKPRGLSHGHFHASVVSKAGDNAETCALAIDQLRILRNSLCHSTSSKMEKVLFDKCVQHAKDAFLALGVSTSPIDVVVSLTESDFPTIEVRRLERMIREANSAHIKLLESITQNTADKDDVKMLAEKMEELKTLQDKGAIPSMPARLRLLIDCEELIGLCPQEGVSSVIVTQRADQAILQGSAVVSTTSASPGTVAEAFQKRENTEAEEPKEPKGAAQGEAVVINGLGQEKIGNGAVPSPQDILSSIASKYLQALNPSTSEEFNGFLQYLERVRKVIIVDVKTGSLIVMVECSSLQVLDELWEDYNTGHLGEMVQKCLVTQEILEEFALAEVKITTTINEEEYRACRELFLNLPNMKASQPRMEIEAANTDDMYYTLGVTQHKKRDFKAALQFKRRALSIRIKLFGEEHEKTADICFSLGLTQHKLADFTAALLHKKQALSIRIRLFGEENKTVADNYHSLGTTQHRLGDLVSAVQSHQRALAIRMKLFGEGHKSTADSFNLLGKTQYELGDFRSALQSYQRGLAIRITLFGEKHKSTFESYHSLGITQHQLGDFKTALQSHQSALAICFKLFGEEHETIADSYYLIGITQQKMGDLQSALQSYEQALAFRVKLLGEENESTAYSYHALGITQHQLGYFKSALHSHQRALAIRSKLFVEDNRSTGDSYYSLGITEYQLGDYESAVRFYELALAIYSQLFGEEHEIIAHNYHSMGVTQHQLGYLRSAIYSHQRALAIRKKLFGLKHERTRESYHSLWATQYKLGTIKPSAFTFN